ncbi:MAG TPA: acireductone synthase [Blastocatellia bacterium]|nr:acireductone synthase [Blastocatellia bacterium]
MAMIFSEASARVILLDVEGTTTPIDFVYQVLFPYARLNVRAYLERNLSSQDVRSDIAKLRLEHTEDLRNGLDPPPLCEQPPAAQVDSLVAYVHWLMDRDRKSTGLKSLQGRIWEEGYRKGDLRGQVFDDVPPAFARWTGQGREICIYSSGSVLAQKLLFSHTTAGDLTGYIKEYFDTNVGAKVEAGSYARIAAARQRHPSEILFVSDAPKELEAAKASGMRTALCVRPGNPPQTPARDHPIIYSFDEVLL